MTSKRNSRVFDNEDMPRQRAESRTMASSSTSSSTSSRTSRTSSYEDMHAAMVEAPTCKTRETTEKAMLDHEMRSVIRSGDVHAAHSVEQHKLPSNFGVPDPVRLTNFGIVSPGVYRSSYPLSEHFEFCQSLGLKTVVTLVNKDDERSVNLGAFVQDNGIRHVIFNMQGTKKEDIPQQTMQSILGVVLDKSCYPVLIHCNQGRHRTGCVIAAARKVAGWSVDSALQEYRSFAEPKVRECDVQYITALEAASLEVRAVETFCPAWSRTRFTIARRRHFIRFVAITVGTMALFLCSAWRYPWV